MFILCYIFVKNIGIDDAHVKHGEKESVPPFHTFTVNAIKLAQHIMLVNAFHIFIIFYISSRTSHGCYLTSFLCADVGSTPWKFEIKWIGF